MDFSRYHTEECGIKGTVSSWLMKASHSHDGFDKFYYLWSAFNSWALIVTLKGGDGAMIRDVAGNENARKFYKECIIDKEPQLIEALRATRGSFPLQSFADLVRIDQKYDWRRNQGSPEYNKKIADSGKHVKVSPSLNAEDFSSVLNCTYAVRCNLIHGSKMATEQEQEFVYVFSCVMEKLFAGQHSLFSLQ